MAMYLSHRMNYQSTSCPLTGLGPHEGYPYIVGRPTAIVLPSAGILVEEWVLLLDIYDTSGKVKPEALPGHCKDLMFVTRALFRVSDLS